MMQPIKAQINTHDNLDDTEKNAIVEKLESYSYQVAKLITLNEVLSIGKQSLKERIQTAKLEL
jgi:hypothetical protein